MTSFLTRALLSASLLACATPAFAVDTFNEPEVEKGAVYFDYFALRTFDNDGSKDNTQDHRPAVGYGVSDRWYTEIAGDLGHDPGDETEFTGLTWTNVYVVTDPETKGLKFGILGAYTYTPHRGDADGLEAGLLFSKDFDKVHAVFNTFFDADVGASRSGSVSARTVLSVKYDYRDWLQPGFELQDQFGELHSLTSLKQNEHAVGPVFYGEVPVGPNGTIPIGYRVGYLFGLTDASSDGNAIGELSYSAKF